MLSTEKRRMFVNVLKSNMAAADGWNLNVKGGPHGGCGQRAATCLSCLMEVIRSVRPRALFRGALPACRPLATIRLRVMFATSQNESFITTRNCAFSAVQMFEILSKSIAIEVSSF